MVFGERLQYLSAGSVQTETPSYGKLKGEAKAEPDRVSIKVYYRKVKKRLPASKLFKRYDLIDKLNP